MPPRASPLLPPLEAAERDRRPPGDAVDSIDDRVDPAPLRFCFDERLDLEEVRRLRGRLGRGIPSAASLDLSLVRSADGAAIRLLELELSRLEEAGCPVSLQRLPRRLQVQLHLHPILRFARDADDLFTDPDLEWPGFRHSDR